MQESAFSHGFGLGGVVPIYCLYLSVFFRATADMLLYAYLPLCLYYSLGETRLWVIGLFMGIPSFVRLLVAPLWGKWTDRLGRQRVFIVTGLLAYGLLLLVLPRYTDPLAITAFTSLMAVLFAAFNPVSRVWLSLSCPREEIHRLANWHQWEAAGYLVSSVVAGWSVNEGYLALTELLTLLGILLLGSACLVSLTLRDIPARSPLRRIEYIQSPSLSSHRRALGMAGIFPLTALLYFLASSTTWEAVATNFGLYFTGFLGGSVRLYGLLIGTSTFVSILAYGSLAGFCERHGYRKTLQMAAWGYTFMYLLMSYPSVRIAGCAYLLPMSTVVRSAMNVLVTSQVPERKRGEAMGLVESVEACSTAWGAVLGGLVAHQQGLDCIPRLAVAGSILLHMLVAR
ncbi:MAG: MFS transporter [Firmicutes bacterium]|nr:MFS transporter [Bacillota bacterium]